MANSSALYAGTRQVVTSGVRLDRQPVQARFVTAEFMDLVVAKHHAFRRLWSCDRGARKGHEIVAEDLYPARLLSCLCAVHEHAVASGNTDAVDDVSAAILDLWTALDTLDAWGRTAGARPRLAFAGMRATSRLGDSAYHRLVERLAKARRAGADALRTHATAVPPGAFLLVDGRAALFAEAAAGALQEHHEAEHGIDLGPDFFDRLNDPCVTCVAVSLDINSTLTTDESYASPALVDRLGAQMEILTERFAERFPHKTLALVLNTGRPALYQWGVQEMLPPLPALRLLGLAESGGVMTWWEEDQYMIGVTLDEAQGLRAELSNLRDYLSSAIRTEVMEEPKSAMLSLRICQRASQGGRPLHVARDGQPVTLAWVEEQLRCYVAARTVRVAAAGAPSASPASGLTAKFNPAAGFVDITHTDINKYSGLSAALRRRGLVASPREALICHIGGTSIDVLPEHATGAGEVNEGAPEAFLVAVANSSEEMREAVLRRRRGAVAARRSILAVHDLLKGLSAAIERSPSSEAARAPRSSVRRRKPVAVPG